MPGSHGQAAPKKSVSSSSRVSDRSRARAARKTAKRQERELRKKPSNSFEPAETLRESSTRKTAVREDFRTREADVPENAAPEEQEQQDRSGKLIDFAKIKRDRKKKKADKLFGRRYADAPASGEGGPRAALYKGEMGRKQKKANNLLSGVSGIASAGSNAGRSLSDRVSRMRQSPRFIWSVTAAACVLAVGVFLYTPAQQYYLQVREYERAQAELDAVTQRNDTLQSQIDFLESEEGIAERAREQYGWVKDGEESIQVVGLEDGQDDSIVPTDISSDEVKAPRTWYTDLLDQVFGYDNG